MVRWTESYTPPKKWIPTAFARSLVSLGVRVWCDGLNRTPPEKWISSPASISLREMDAHPVILQDFARAGAKIALGLNRTGGVRFSPPP